MVDEGVSMLVVEDGAQQVEVTDPARFSRRHFDRCPSLDDQTSEALHVVLRGKDVDWCR
jgi:hypothetical protein